jgi:hypothetical protein
MSHTWWLVFVFMLLGSAPVCAQTASMTLAWDANVEGDLAGYVVQLASQPGGPYQDRLTTTQTTAIVDGLQSGTTYYAVVRAINTLGLKGGPSNEVSATMTGLPPADECAAITGRYAVSVFPTSLLRTGNGGPGSKTRFDFQVASPNAPVTGVAIYVNGAQIAAMSGTDLTALAGMWFAMPASGTYALSITATNSRSCAKTATYGPPLVVP